MNPKTRNYVMWAVVITMFLVMMTMTQNSMTTKPANELGFSDMVAAAESGDIKAAKVDVNTGAVTGERTDGTPFLTNSSPYAAGETQKILMEAGVNLDYKPIKQQSMLASFLFSVLPLILFIGIAIFFMRSMQGGGRGGAMSFGKSKAKLLTEMSGKVTFDDVAGVEAAKEDLKEVVEFLQDSTRFTRLGAKIPTGALLVGPPGTGKTLLARAVAGEGRN